MPLVKIFVHTLLIVISSLLLVTSTPLVLTAQAQGSDVTTGFSNTLLTTAPDSGEKFEPELKELSMSPQSTFGNTLSAEELKLVGYINSYRAQNGLAAIPISKSLTTVAQLHARDLSLHGGNPHTNPCNIHSWSRNFPAGFSWTPVCYTDANPPWQLMANKGREITRGVYSADTWENSHMMINMDGSQATNNADLAMGRIGGIPGWPQSPGHNALMLNRDFNGSRWSTQTWQALGVGIVGGYAVMWVGNQADPAGTVSLNPQTQITSPNSNKNVFDAGQSIPITANASRSGGAITRVEFYNGSTLIGTDTNGADGWSFNWASVPQGNYSIKTRAYGNDGSTGESNVINIQVVSGYTEQQYFSWNDGRAPNSTWNLVSNPNTFPVNVQIEVGNDVSLAYTIPAGGRITPEYPGVASGPVVISVKDNQRVIATQRSLYQLQPGVRPTFDEMAGIQASSLTNEYYFTWVDNLDGNQTWNIATNPNNFSITVEANLAGTSYGTRTLAPRESWVFSPSGVRNGPLIFRSTNNFFASQRSIIRSNNVLSFNQYPGIPSNSLSQEYYFTWNDTTAGNSAWTLVSLPKSSPTSTTVEIYLKDRLTFSKVLQPGEIWTPLVPNLMSGPVRVKSSSRPIIATQRVLFNNSFNEFVGISSSSLSNNYLYTWNDTVNGNFAWTLVGNPSATQTVSADVLIAGRVVATKTLQPSEIWTPIVLNILNGPVQVRSSGNVFTTQRVLYGGDFNEMAGIRNQ